MNKILVCITIQENSKRLMKKGYDLAKSSGGELHILHIRHGETIFETPDSSQLFEELFIYGSELGGQVHFLCSTDIPHTISDFITQNAITHLVIGKPPVCTNGLAPNVFEKLVSLPKDIQLYVLDRENH